MWISLLYHAYNSSKNCREWTEPSTQEVLLSAIRRVDGSEEQIRCLLTLMQYRKALPQEKSKPWNYYGQELRSGELVQLVNDAVLVPATVVGTWRIAHVVRMKKNGEIRWIPGESDLSLD